MEITAVVIDEERTFADALAIRLNAEEDLSVVAVAQPTATTMGRTPNTTAGRGSHRIHAVVQGDLGAAAFDAGDHARAIRRSQPG